MSDVQKSISTIPRAPSSVLIRSATEERARREYIRTHSIYSTEGVAIGDTITFTRPHGDTSGSSSQVCIIGNRELDTREILVEVCEEHRIRSLHGRRHVMPVRLAKRTTESGGRADVRGVPSGTQ